MLSLHRKENQSIIIELDSDITPDTPIGDIFNSRTIEVKIYDIKGKHARLAIQADKAFRIIRKELLR